MLARFVGHEPPLADDGAELGNEIAHLNVLPRHTGEGREGEGPEEDF
jgi:hypothetical protein